MLELENDTSKSLVEAKKLDLTLDKELEDQLSFLLSSSSSQRWASRFLNRKTRSFLPKQNKEGGWCPLENERHRTLFGPKKWCPFFKPKFIGGHRIENRFFFRLKNSKRCSSKICTKKRRWRGRLLVFFFFILQFFHILPFLRTVLSSLSLSLLSLLSPLLSKNKTQMSKTYKLKGQWKGKSAGGCQNHPTWRYNLQLFLSVPEETTVRITLSQDSSFSSSSSSSENGGFYHIGFYVARADNPDRRQLMMSPQNLVCFSFLFATNYCCHMWTKV